MDRDDSTLWDPPLGGDDAPVVDDDEEELERELDRLKRALDLEPEERMVGRFRLGPPLGKGGMGVVHAAFDPQLDRMVALKLVRPRRPGSRERLQARLQREARALARLTHPNVVSVYDVGTDGDELFVAMELVDGPTLLEWQWQQERSIDELLGVYLQAAAGLIAAHDAGLVHRDFKPENVFVTTDGRVLVGDFGLANLDDALTTAVDHDQHDEHWSSGLTEAGSVLGTLGYMAPEQLRGDSVDPRADQFGFCVALWEAITGERPFVAGNVDAMLDAIQAGEPRLAVRVPRRLRVVLQRGLAFAPEARFESLRELVAALESLRGRSPWVGVGLGLAAIAVAVLALLSLREPELRCEPRARIDRVWTQGRAGLVEQLSRGSASVLERRAEAAVAQLRSHAVSVCRNPSDARARVLERAIEELETALAKPESMQLEGWSALLDQLAALDLDRPPIDPEVAAAIDRSRLHEWRGEAEQATNAAEQAVALALEAEPRGWSASRSEALLQRGRLRINDHEYQAALEDYTHAEAHAEGSGYAALLLRARLEAAAVSIKFLRDAERGGLALLRAEPLLLRRSGPFASERALRHSLASSLASQRSELGPCIGHALAAIFIHAVVHPDPVALARANETFAVSLERLGVANVEPLYALDDQLLRERLPQAHHQRFTTDYNRARHDLDSEDEQRRADGRATLQRLHREGDRSTRSLAARALLYDSLVWGDLARMRTLFDELRPEHPEDAHVLMASARLGELDRAALDRVRAQHLERGDLLFVVMLEHDIASALGASACDLVEVGRARIDQLAGEDQQKFLREGFERLWQSHDCE